MNSEAISFDQTRKKWAEKGFSCGTWQDPPGQTWSDFTHDEDELVILVEGQIEILFKERILHPEPGQEVLIPAKTSHTIKNTGETVNKWFYGYRLLTHS